MEDLTIEKGPGNFLVVALWMNSFVPSTSLSLESSERNKMNMKTLLIVGLLVLCLAVQPSHSRRILQSGWMAVMLYWFIVERHRDVCKGQVSD